MNHTYRAMLNQLQIRPLESNDLEYLRQWRNDKKISKYFRKISRINTRQQREWFHHYLTQEDSYYWSIVEDRKVIGALSIYNINHNKAEIGKIMIGVPTARGKGYGYQSLIMAMKIGFDFIHLRSLQLNVHENNSAALSIYKRAGFTTVGAHPFDETGNEYEMEINADTFKEVNPMSNNIVIYSVNRGGGILKPNNIFYTTFEYERLEVA